VIVTERMNICVRNEYCGSKNISLLLGEIFIANTTMLQRTTSDEYYGELAVDRPVKKRLAIICYMEKRKEYEILKGKVRLEERKRQE